MSEPRRAYVVSDVHGHVHDLRMGLRRADLVDEEDRWVGGGASLHVLGDLMDRGPEGIGVVHLLRDLQQQAPEDVHVLLGNHEALALGAKLFRDRRFEAMWRANGGRESDRDGLDDDDVDWLRSLPAMAVAVDHLLMHSDITDYRLLGATVADVNESVATGLRSGRLDEYWDLWALLTSRYHFVGQEGTEAAADMLRTFGGSTIVHGHSIIGTLLNVPSFEVTGPVRYAEGLVVDIDGGRYDGGPLLLVRMS